MDRLVLAKDAIDVGVMTNDWPSYESAFSRLGIAYDHLLKVGGGVHQHRFASDHSVIKINAHRDALRSAPSALHTIHLLGAVDHEEEWVSPDGVRFVVRPADDGEPATLQVSWTTPNPDEMAAFLCDGFGAVVSAQPHTVSIGRSNIVLEQGESVGPIGELNASGVRYLTVQIRDVEREHQRLLALGASEGRAPVQLGETARISFVRALDGTWIELSQRASLTGPLPPL